MHGLSFSYMVEIVDWSLRQEWYDKDDVSLTAAVSPTVVLKLHFAVALFLLWDPIVMFKDVFGCHNYAGAA